jgi:hypothetical protein
MKWTLAGASISFGRPDGTDGGHDGGGCGAADRPHFRVVVAFRRPRTAHEEPAPTASATASDAGIRTGTFRSSPRARARGLMTLGNDNAVLPAPARPSPMNLTPFVQEIHLLKVFQRFEIPQRMHLIRSRLH